jgi:hypothetical protein
MGAQVFVMVETSASFDVMITYKGMSFLGNIIASDESEYQHTPETKASPQFEQKKENQSPSSANSQRTGQKKSRRILFFFLNDKGMEYTNYMPRGVTGNA